MFTRLGHKTSAINARAIPPPVHVVLRMRKITKQKSWQTLRMNLKTEIMKNLDIFGKIWVLEDTWGLGNWSCCIYFVKKWLWQIALKDLLTLKKAKNIDFITKPIKTDNSKVFFVIKSSSVEKFNFWSEFKKDIVIGEVLSR